MPLYALLYHQDTSTVMRNCKEFCSTVVWFLPSHNPFVLRELGAGIKGL